MNMDQLKAIMDWAKAAAIVEARAEHNVSDNRTRRAEHDEYAARVHLYRTFGLNIEPDGTPSLPRERCPQCFGTRVSPESQRHAGGSTGDRECDTCGYTAHPSAFEPR